MDCGSAAAENPSNGTKRKFVRFCRMMPDFRREISELNLEQGGKSDLESIIQRIRYASYDGMLELRAGIRRDRSDQ